MVRARDKFEGRYGKSKGLLEYLATKETLARLNLEPKVGRSAEDEKKEN